MPLGTFTNVSTTDDGGSSGGGGSGCIRSGVPPESHAALSALDCWIVDALRRTGHPSHWSLPETLAWISRFRPKRAIITNMHLDLDYDTLCRELPPHIRPAFDGMIVGLAEMPGERP